MKCQKCGAELGREASVCGECGAKVERTRRFCRECGAMLDDGAKFCSTCGAKVINIDALGETPASASPDGGGKTNGEAEKSAESTQAAGSVPAAPLTAAAGKESSKALGAKIKEKALDVWRQMETFYRAVTAASILIVILTIIAMCTGNARSIFISMLQIGAVVAAVLAHRGLISMKQDWYKYLILCAAVILSIVNIASYSVPSRESEPAEQQEPQTPVYTTAPEVQAAKQVIVPCSAEDCLGKAKEDAASVFLAAGFNNISEQELADLAPEAREAEGTVTAVTVDGKADFSAGQELPNETGIVITYHSVKKVKAPAPPDDIESAAQEELAQKFKDAGFVSIQTDEVYDLDPDNNDSEFINEVTINGEAWRDTETEYPLTADVKIVIHRICEKYTLKVVIDFVPNLLFSTYDVKMEVNGETETLPHGEDAEFEYRLKPGRYDITFMNAEKPSVKGMAEFNVIGDTEVSFEIACYSNEVSVETLYVENKGAVGENEALVPASASDCRFENCKDVEKKFKDAGFTNISMQILYDIRLGWTKEGEIESVSIDGRSDFTRGDIFKKDAPIVIIYHMKEADDPTRIPVVKSSSDYLGMYYLDVEQSFKKMGFTNIEFNTVTTTDTANFEGQVNAVKISGITFAAGDRFKPNEKVSIDYYLIEEQPEEENIITIDNNSDFAAILTAEYVDPERQTAFVKKHLGELVEFDCMVFSMEQNKNYKTIYSYRLVPDEDKDHIGAALFYLEDMSRFDFKWDEETRPEYLYSGSAIRIRAEIVTGDDPLYIYLRPVCTWGR